MDQRGDIDSSTPAQERLLAYARARPSGPLLSHRPVPLPTLGELAEELGLERSVCLDALTTLVDRGLLEVRLDAQARLDVRLGPADTRHSR